MKPSIKMVCTDFDGTVYQEYSDPPVPVVLQELIGDLQRQGVRWVVNTGRDLSSLMEELGRADLEIRPDYAVVVEREIYRKDDHIYTALDPWNRQCSLAHETLFEQIRDDIPDLFEWVNEWFEATVYEDPYSPFCLVARHSQDADEIISHLEQYCEMIDNLVIVRNDVYARFSHVAFNKGTALQEIARLENILPAEIIAAGDHYNDLPMLSLEYASHLITPSNAIPLVKESVTKQGGRVMKGRAGEGVYEGFKKLLIG